MRKFEFGLLVGAASILSISHAGLANDQVGTLTQIQGDVKVFSHPSKTLPKGEPGTHVLYEGEYFLSQEAKAGDQVEKGNIVRTSPGAKARVVYPNGDQFNVGAGTAYKISWSSEDGKGQTDINLMYGKLRGVIEKGGPRSHLKIKTRSAVMGVRGTDFFIAEGGADKTTEVSIMRGSVEVTPIVPPTKMSDEKGNTEAKPVKVKSVTVQAGYSAEIDPGKIQMEAMKATEPVVAKVELRKTTQEEMAGIQKSATITTPAAERAPADEQTKKAVETLEKKATATMLQDIKAYDKKLYATLEKQPDAKVSVDALNQAALQTLAKEAPKAPEKRKPYKSELDDLESSAYDKYFKTID